MGHTALIGDIQKFSTQDGPGIRTTVFLKGCPLNCAWCHNPEMIKPDQQMIISPSRCIGCMACVEACPEGGITVTDEGPSIDFSSCRACGECHAVCFSKAITPVAREMTVDEVMEKVLQDRNFYENSGGGVTISGGELLLHYEFASELIRACEKEGIGVCLDTSGYGDTGQLMDLAGQAKVNHVLYDIKHMDDEEHKKLTGVGNLQILENLRALAADENTRKKIWIRMPLISGINDSDEEIHAAADLMCELGLSRVSLLGYHEMGIAKARNTGADYTRFEAPSAERMDEINKYLEGRGLDSEISGIGS
ncbi:MAG: glycyl-radical enzyme activating protein [Clostridia bacterium]|nr:glycyl-radical enzyme activating protein [Clostridia bacterium]